MNPDATTLRRPCLASVIAGETTLSAVSLVVVAVALLTLSAKIQIPWWPVPFTMQTYVVLVVGMGYGARLGVLAIAAYVALGAMGLPVFAGTPERGIGVSYILGPTGGYLIGFLAAASVCGWLAERKWDRHFVRSLVAITIGHGVIFACGVGWLAMHLGGERAIAVGFTPFILATLLKTVAAAVSLPVVWKWQRR